MMVKRLSVEAVLLHSVLLQGLRMDGVMLLLYVLLVDAVLRIGMRRVMRRLWDVVW